MLTLLLILLSLAWLAVTVMVIAVCRMAARGERDLGGASHPTPVPSASGTVRSGRILTLPHGG